MPIKTPVKTPAIGCCLLACLALPATGQVTYTDITAAAGISLPGDLVGDANNESLAWGDYDGDGDEDLYLTVQGANQLFENQGDGSFVDVTAAAGVGHGGWGVGTAFGDLDNDGDLDLYVVNFGSGPDVLYRNDGPDGLGQTTFTDVTETSGITAERSSRGMALLDFDRDGLLDIYVNAIGADLLYHNLGGLTFTDVATTVCGPVAPTCVHSNSGQGVGVVASDLDGNGWIDLYTGNRSFDANRLFLNSGGTFTDATVSAGVDQPIGLGMGVLALDYDRDLDFDLYWTAWPNEPNAFFQNLGVTPFEMQEVAAGTGTLDPFGWGISCNAGDVDNDGWQDFFVTNGFSSGSGPNVLFQNDGDGTFSDITGSAFAAGSTIDGRGAAFADIDGDGDLDLALTDGNSANFLETGTRLWRNDTDNDHHWLVLKLEGTESNRSAIGARVEVETDLGSQVQEVSGGAGRGSQNSLPLEFGLGDASQLLEVRIRWPNGLEQTVKGLAMDQVHTILESLFSDGFESGDMVAWDTPTNEPY